MQDGREPKPADVEIERHESGESARKAVDPGAQLDEVARTPGDKVGGDEEGRTVTETEGDPDAVQIDTDNEPADGEDPEEAQSPT